jgi:hypothetical protein
MEENDILYTVSVSAWSLYIHEVCISSNSISQVLSCSLGSPLLTLSTRHVCQPAYVHPQSLTSRLPAV